MLIAHDTLPDDHPPIERRIDMLLSPLSHQDRRMLTLYHFENRTARDVSQQLGMSEGNVRIRLMRSHRALRDRASAMRVAGLL
jgi:RNA polymerase sigma factor (sigma-70 family)